MDFGQVWSDRFAVDFGDVIFTPGIGARYFSPIGPIRIDIGYYGGQGEDVAVLTTELCVRTDDGCSEPAPGEIYLRSQLEKTGMLRTLDLPVRWNTKKSFLDRLQIHFSIGQAF